MKRKWEKYFTPNSFLNLSSNIYSSLKSDSVCQRELRLSLRRHNECAEMISSLFSGLLLICEIVAVGNFSKALYFTVCRHSKVLTVYDLEYLNDSVRKRG